MDLHFIIYIVVGVAAGAFGWVLWQGVVGASDVHAANLDAQNALNPNSKQPPPIERFVTPGRLFRIRVVFAALPALVVPAAFLVSGFDDPVFLIAFALAFAVVGWLTPPLYFQRLLKKRQAAFENRILDLTMSVASALKSGMAPHQAIDRVRARMKGPMREELDTLYAEYGIGVELGRSFERLTERMPCEDMILLTAAIKLTTKTGGSLADVLSEMTETIRKRREFSDKVKTLTAAGRMEGLVLALMPIVAFVLFYVIQPDLMRVLITTMIGWTALGIAATLVVVGYLSVLKISKVEV